MRTTKIYNFETAADSSTWFQDSLKDELLHHTLTQAIEMLKAYTYCPVKKITVFYSNSQPSEMIVRSSNSSMIVMFNPHTHRIDWVG